MVGQVAGGGRTEKPMLKAGRSHFKYKAKRNSWPKVGSDDNTQHVQTQALAVAFAAMVAQSQQSRLGIDGSLTTFLDKGSECRSSVQQSGRLGRCGRAWCGSS